MHLKMAKYEFLKREVVYLGLKIDAEGLHPVDVKWMLSKERQSPKMSKSCDLSWAWFNTTTNFYQIWQLH